MRVFANTTKVRIKKTENPVNKSIRRMCLHFADLHTPLYFKSKVLYSRGLNDFLFYLQIFSEMEIQVWTTSREGLGKRQSWYNSQFYNSTA